MAYLNAALTALRNQLREMFDNIIIGWIADSKHSSSSQHQPDADGSVDAIDPMIGPTFTKDDADDLWDAIIANKDPRLWCMIWWDRIVSGHPVTQEGKSYKAWEPRPYIGTSDPHTNHMHIESTQALEDHSQDWNLTMPLTTADFNKIRAIVETSIETVIEEKLALAKLGGRTVGGSINNLVDWGLSDHPVDKPAPTK